MMKYVLAVLCGIAAVGIGYTATASVSARHECLACEGKTIPVAADAPTTAPAAVDLKNTKCLSTLEDTDGGPTVTYNGKIYHFCCEDCVKKFKKDPKKFEKAVEKDPAKYGVQTAKNTK